MREFTGIRDWKLNNINEGDVVESQQGTRFVVEKVTDGWRLIQSNKGTHGDLQGDWFVLEPYMQPNLEVIGNIYDNPELIN